MKLVLLLFFTTLIGFTFGHNGPHAGNFMAQCPCFSFQGQNILWPAGPQGIAGMNTPWNCFNHPFFSGAGGAGPKPPNCILGAPHEASSPSAHVDDVTSNAPTTSPAVIPRDHVPSETIITPVVSKSEAVLPTPVLHAETPVPNITPVPAAEIPVAIDTPVQPVETPASVATPVQPVEEASAPVVHSGQSAETPDPVVTPDQSIENSPPVVSQGQSSVPVAATPKQSVVSSTPDATIDKSVETPSSIVTQVQSSETLAPVINTEHSVEALATAVSPSQETVHPATEANSPVIGSAPLISANSVSAVLAPTESEVPKPLGSTLDLTPSPSSSTVDSLLAASTIPSVNVEQPIASPHIEEASASLQPDVQANSTEEAKIPEFCIFPPLIDACNVTSQNLSALGEPINYIDPINAYGFPDTICDVNLLGPHDLDVGVPGVHSFHPCFYKDHDLLHDNYIHDVPTFYPCYEDLGYETKILPPISSLNITDIDHLNLTDIQNCLPSGAKIVQDPADLNCVQHKVINDIKPVQDECITHLPVVRNKITQKEETFTRHIPIVTEHVSTKEEKRLCHIPIVKQHTHNIIEDFTDHIPITNSRLVPLVQTYTNHVPVTRSFIRPIVETSEGHVPIVDTNVHPLVHSCVHSLPRTGRGIPPVIHNDFVVPTIENIPRYTGLTYNDQSPQHYPNYPLPTVEQYEDTPNMIPTWRGNPALCDQVQPDYGNRIDAPYNPQIREDEPEFEQTLNDFRRNLYFPCPEIARNFEEFQGESSPSIDHQTTQTCSEHSDNPIENHQETNGFIKNAINDISGREPGNISGDFLDHEPLSGVEPHSAPLENEEPFSQENAQDVTDESAGNHPDYCD